MEQHIRERLAALETARSAYVQEANRQLMGFDAAIGELRALLEDDGIAEPADLEQPGREPSKVRTRRLRARPE